MSDRHSEGDEADLECINFLSMLQNDELRIFKVKPYWMNSTIHNADIIYHLYTLVAWIAPGSNIDFTSRGFELGLEYVFTYH